MPTQPDPRREAAPGNGQLVLPFGHTPSLAEADFMVGDGNRLAYERILAFPGWAEPTTLLIGPEKAGKSHLARIFADRSGAVFVAPHDMERLAGEADATPLVIEDVDRAGYAEPALFHLLNQSMRARRPLLLTARAGIDAWPFRTEDVRSRARRAVAFEMAPTDDIQLSQMLVKLLGDRQLAVDPSVVRYLVRRMERSNAEAVALIELMDTIALARGTAITRRIAAEALALRRAARGEAAEDDDPESEQNERDE